MNQPYSFLDTLPAAQPKPPVHTPTDRWDQFESLVRWMAVNSVRLDDQCAKLEARLREADAVIGGAMVAWQMLIEAGLLPERHQAEVVQLRVAE